CEHIVVTDAKAANTRALQALNAGASGLCFSLEKEADVATLLQDIELPFIYSAFRFAQNDFSAAANIAAYIASKGWDISTMDCFLETGYAADLLPSGKMPVQTDIDRLPETLRINGGVLTVDTTPLLNAGANTTYELACSLALINENLQVLEEAQQMSLLKTLHIIMGTDTAFFEQIAKLRAFRKLLDLLCSTYDIKPAVHLHLETGHTYRSPFDSYSNLLRDTIAGMAAVLGGCNSLYIHAFNETQSGASDFSNRMSRNQQLIFKEESYLDKSADPAAGSYYVETLTETFAEQAWQQFQGIEQAGGLIRSFAAGTIKQAVENQAQQLVQEYREGKRVLIGVNKFVNANDAPNTGQPEALPTAGLQPLQLYREIL
ncbi:MAG: hypothetical protein EOP49_20760, partial [Sphingobacteriales bacterium]